MTTETDSTGRYELESVAAGTYTVVTGGLTGTAAPQTVTVGLSNVTVPALQVGTDVLSGTVVDPTGSPVSGANVLLVSGSLANAAVGMTASTDANGDFTLANLAPGTYSLFVLAAGFPGQVEQVNVTANPSPLSVQLAGGIALSGTITDSSTGLPVANATVDIISLTSKLDIATVQADATGLYEATNLPPGTYDLVFADPGGTHALSEVTSVVVAGVPLVVNAKLAAAATDLVGTVTDAQGRPVAGANVLILDSAGNVLTVASTDFSGAYSVTTLPAGSYGVKISSIGYLPSAVTNVTLSGNGTIAGPNFSLSIAGVDSTVFTVLRDGLDGFVGSLVQRQIAKFNPAGSPTIDEIRAAAEPFLNVVDNDPAACTAELDAGIALHLRLSTLQPLLDQWVADFNDLVQTEGHLLTNLLEDLIKLGIAITPFVGQAKQAVGAAQLTLEESEFILATIDASVTLSESLTQLAVNIITGKGPDDVGLALKGFVITFIGQLATAAGLDGGSFASIPFIQKFMSKHGGLVKFLGPITAILTIGVDVLANSEAIVAAEKKCANDKTTYLNAVAEAQRDIRVLAQAIIDCHSQKENKPEPLPPPPAPTPVAWSSNNLPNLIHVTSNLDNGQLGAVVPGSLRAAINQVNTGHFSGPVELDFSQLTNTTILLQQDLPPINFPVYIYGMAGANCTMLVIDGSQIPGFETQNTGGQAFDLKADNSTIRFVDFVNFAGNPVLIQGNNDTIYACHVGVNITGKVAMPNGGVGIAVTGSNNTVGSIVPGNGNIVSSNGLTGSRDFRRHRQPCRGQYHRARRDRDHGDGQRGQGPQESGWQRGRR